MDATLGKFVDDFAALVALAQQAQQPTFRGENLLDRLDAHLKTDVRDLPTVMEEISAHRLADADIALAAFAAEDPESVLLGIGGGDQRHHMSLSDILQHASHVGGFPVGQPDYTNLAVGPAQQRQALALGMRLFRRHGHPLAVLMRAANPRFGQAAARLEVLCAEPAALSEFLTDFRERMRTHSVLKGQVVSFTMEEFGASGAGVTFHERPHVAAGDVILAPGVLARIARHVVEVAEARGNLRRLGQHLKRGVLLYGPPGTGKTHTVRHLLSRSEGTTAILLSGGSLAFISEAARMARALQPSIVVLEDCDLIAEDRSFGHGPQPLLFEVLDAMDGLDEDADVAFVLTTNRVEALEHALAQRPGRVDLAVEIPRPDAEQREALIRLYARSLGFGTEAIAQAAERTAGTTASFARELVRRTVVGASARGNDPGDADLLAAVGELMADAEALTRSLLGSDGGEAHGRELPRMHTTGQPMAAGASGSFAYTSELQFDPDEA
ncbi:26S protease regulatory subunit [Arthrobacter sp. CAU 1506]|uniref:AAA family ATPase n=1 Tax=Arthrobacter sp. CAU 1506 TaxID=2560052 RepID=UPI0010AC0463|nr:ATP-binding protein [Arthrobacter sp. CAU 1506]TJY70870.1 26S protease regulatory subunit [Arthrobacter sp. CAU 1506]